MWKRIHIKGDLLMNKQDMLKLAIIGMMAGSAVLGAQSSTTNQNQSPGGDPALEADAAPAPKAGHHKTPSSKSTKMAMNSKPQETRVAKKHGIDTSVRSSYSSSNDKNASLNRSFENSCGQDSCNHTDPTKPPVKDPAAGKAKVVKKSKLK